MSQLNVNMLNDNIQMEEINNHPQDIQNQQNNNNLPQELQNARPAQPRLSTFQRVMYGLAIGIGSVATLGVGALLGLGIYQLCKKCEIFNQPPAPRVPDNELPEAEPGVDADNSVLISGMHDLNLPEQHRESLKSALQELSSQYGEENVPKDLRELQALRLKENRTFVEKLRAAVKNAGEYVNPGHLKRLAKEILEHEVQLNCVGSALKQKAHRMGIELEPQDVDNAIHFLRKDLEGKNTDAAAQGAEKENIQKFLNHEGMNSADGVNEAFSHIEDFVDVNDIAQRARLKSAVDADSLPPSHKAALEDVLSDMRTRFGEGIVPTDMKKILDIRLEGKGDVRTELRKMADNAQNAISPQDLADSLKDMLMPSVRHSSMSKALGEVFEKNHDITLHPRTLSLLLGKLGDKCQAIKESMEELENHKEAGKALNDQKETVEAFVEEIAANVKGMEDEFLPQVQADIKPVLQNLIRALPFDSDNKEASREQVMGIIPYMSSWKSSIPMGDASLNSFCTRMTDELNSKLETLAEGDGHFSGDIYGSFLKDSSQNRWNLNGKVMEYPTQEQLKDEFTQLVPSALDQQFLSKLTNQHLWDDVETPLQGAWSTSGDQVNEQELKNGLTFIPPRELNKLGHLIPPQSAGLSETPSFGITVSPDKKHAVVEMHLPKAIVTNDSRKIAVGSNEIVMQIHCDLSGGDPALRPRVTGVQLSQNVKSI